MLCSTTLPSSLFSRAFCLLYIGLTCPLHPTPSTHALACIMLTFSLCPSLPPTVRAPCTPPPPQSPGAGGVLSGEGIMSLLFGRGRSVLAAQDVFRGLPRLPMPPQPLRGDLAAALNNATRGYDIGQANPIWVRPSWREGGRREGGTPLEGRAVGEGPRGNCQQGLFWGWGCFCSGSWAMGLRAGPDRAGGH